MCLCEQEKGKVYKDYKKRIINEENYWDHNVEGDAVIGPVISEGTEEVIQALNEMKTGKALGLSEISLELIAASRGSKKSIDG